MNYPVVTSPIKKKKGPFNFLPRSIAGLAPPHPHLLLSNIPPTDEERIDICRSLILAQNKIEKLKRRRPSGGGKYSSWRFGGSTRSQTKRSSLTEYIRLHEGILSVVRLIPTEIWRLIFVGTLPSPSENPTLTSLDTSVHFPWVLTHVSQYWRDISLHTPELWTVFPKIALDGALSGLDCHESIIKILTERSHPLPLDLCIAEHTSSRRSISYDNPLLNSLLFLSDRWRTLNLTIEAGTLQHFQSVEGCLPSLEELTIFTWSRRNRALDYVTCLRLFQTAPLLRSIELSGYPPSEMLFFKFPSSRFREEVFILLRDFLGFLQDRSMYLFDPSPRIREIRIVDFKIHASMAKLKRVTLPNLVVLDIQFDPATLKTQPLFKYLKLPCLDELRLVSMDPELIHNVSIMIMRSGTECLIKKLCIRIPFIPSGNLTNLLHLTPLLTHLSISLPPKGDILSLALTEADQILVPLLQICVFHVGPTLSEDTAQDLNEFASARCNLSPTSSASHSSLWVGDQQPLLRAVHLHFSRVSLQHEQRILNRWIGTPEAFALAEDKDVLIGEITKLLGHNERKVILNADTSVLLHTLRIIKEMDLRRAADIYRSGIHILFHRLANQGPSDNSNLRTLCRWANIILRRWEPIFKAEMHNFRWAMKFRSLVYISDSNPLRLSDDPMKMVYGLDGRDLGPLYMPYPLEDIR